MTKELGHYGTKRRLLSYDDLSRRMRLDETADNSSSPFYSQGNSSSPYYYWQSNSSSPNWSTPSKTSSAKKYVVPIGCSIAALALVVALVFWWVGYSRRLTPQLGRPVNDVEMPPLNTNNNTQGNLEGNQIAVKKLDHKRLKVSKEQFKREMGILMEVKHKNLVKFLAYCDEGDDRFLCFEFLSGGSLDRLLYASKRNESKKPCVRGNDTLLDWGMRYYIIKEVCAGLHYLHVERDIEEKILHLDLKASNILIDQGGKVVKITDFGISRLLDANRTYEYITNEYIGMRAYLPKECLTPKPKVSAKVDIYIYGMLLLEIITGWCATDEEFPGVPKFIEMAREALGNQDVMKLLDHPLRERLEDRSVAEVLNCIKIACNCLNDNPCQRPDTKEIAQRLDIYS
ncbi:unnamed protein product [Urochloa humidicola]